MIRNIINKVREPAINISAEHHHKDEVSKQIKRFSGKRVEQITGKWTDTESCHRVAGEDNADSGISSLEEFG